VTLAIGGLVLVMVTQELRKDAPVSESPPTPAPKQPQVT
jgi:hypothetical protein